jgi:hypothetical protein
MTQLATTAPADTDRTTEIAALNDAARAGSLVTSRTVFTRALADILAGEDPDPGTRQLNLMMGQHALRRLINETPIDPGNDPHGERDFGVVEHQVTRSSGRSTSTPTTARLPGDRRRLGTLSRASAS